MRQVRFCPRCQSKDISADTSSNTYKCNACGYSGVFFPEPIAKE